MKQGAMRTAQILSFQDLCIVMPRVYVESTILCGGLRPIKAFIEIKTGIVVHPLWVGVEAFRCEQGVQYHILVKITGRGL